MIYDELTTRRFGLDVPPVLLIIYQICDFSVAHPYHIWTTLHVEETHEEITLLMFEFGAAFRFLSQN